MSGASGALSLRRLAVGGGALVVCPCHVLYGGAMLLGGALGIAAPLAPELQDGAHALYLAAAGLGIALWIRRGAAGRDRGDTHAPPRGSRPRTMARSALLDGVAGQHVDGGPDPQDDDRPAKDDPAALALRAAVPD
jgi:hypothetical protein